MRPLEARPVKYVAFKSAQDNNISCPFSSGKVKRNAERHHVPSKVQAVDQDRVPGKFPTLDFPPRLSCSSLTVSAMAARPSSPSRSIRLSLCGSVVGGG